jgi:hypothetical protein
MKMCIEKFVHVPAAAKLAIIPRSIEGMEGGGTASASRTSLEDENIYVQGPGQKEYYIQRP